MNKEVKKLNEFLGTAFRLINQLDDKSVNDREVVNSFLKGLEKLNQKIEDPELKKYIKWLSDREAYSFWEKEVFETWWDPWEGASKGARKIKPIVWYVWDPVKKEFARYPTRKLIKIVLHLRLYNLIGEFLKKAPDGKDIIGQELLDVKNGLSLDYSLDDILEILGDEKLVQKSEEILKVVEKKKKEFEALSFSLDEVSKLVEKRVYDPETREKLGDWVYWVPIFLSTTPSGLRSFLIDRLENIEDLIGRVNKLREEKLRPPTHLKDEIEAQKNLFRTGFFALLDYVNSELKSNYPKSEWFEEILTKKEKKIEEKPLVRRKVKRILRTRKRELSEESILEVLESGPLTAMEIKERLVNLGFEVDEDSFSNLITSLSAKGKIELTYGPSGIKWKIRTEN